MPLRYVLDEDSRGRLWQAIRRHNTRSPQVLDVTRVGDADDLPLQSTDPEVLLWTEREDRILVTNDKSTMPVHLTEHLNSGHHSPGVFLIRPGSGVSESLEFLVLAAYVSEPEEWRDRPQWIP